MYTIEKIQENLIEIKKSKFIAWIFPVETQDDVEMYLDNLRKDNRDATHICYAYVLSSPNLEKACDNGEPDGTAGKPILDVIKKNNLSNVLIAVIRYFGGIKLGAGGLVRAYSSASSEVLKLCKIGQVKLMKTYEISTKIPNSKALLDLVKNNCNIINQTYAEEFKVTISSENIDFLNNLRFDIKVQEKGQSRVFYDKD